MAESWHGLFDRAILKDLNHAAAGLRVRLEKNGGFFE